MKAALILQEYRVRFCFLTPFKERHAPVTVGDCSKDGWDEKSMHGGFKNEAEQKHANPYAYVHESSGGEDTSGANWYTPFGGNKGKANLEHMFRWWPHYATRGYFPFQFLQNLLSLWNFKGAVWQNLIFNKAERLWGESLFPQGSVSIRKDR